MKKYKIVTIKDNILKTVDKHSPEILIGIGITGMITSTVLAVKATPKAIRLIANKKEEVDSSKLTSMETINVTWHCYIPSVVTGSLSIACLLGANSVNSKRNAAIATAYALSDSRLKEYQNKVIESIGKEKEQEINKSISKDRIRENPIDNKNIIITDKGNSTCYDSISGRYFKSDIDTINKAVNELNSNLIVEGYVSLNDFYYEIGLDNTRLGDDLGWNINNGLIDIKFDACIGQDEKPCIVLDYMVAPKYDFT